MSKRFADPFKAIAEIKQIEAPAPPIWSTPRQIHEKARIERLDSQGPEDLARHTPIAGSTKRLRAPAASLIRQQKMEANNSRNGDH